MSATLGSVPEEAPQGEGDDGKRSRAKIVKRVWLSVMVFAIAGVVVGAVVLIGWMVDETHFDRASREFDAFEAQLENLPGVDGVDKERWVEAPTFSSPTSWMSVTVDEAALPGLLEAACSTDYADPVTWAIHVRTPAGAEVSLHTAPTSPNRSDDAARCPDFGFDAVRLVDELDRVAPGLDMQPAIWDNGRFAVVAIEDAPSTGFAHLLPLIEHADDLLAAAGLDATELLDVNSANLAVTLRPDERLGYLALLSELTAEHHVSSYWAGDGGGAPVDGVDRVQIVAPDQQHAMIQNAIRSSRLSVADLPVRFLEQ
ncbi:hypothetical protein [Microbacterium sp. CPCC 204701]|uniref:hypothetical protein n=1 Tax=Microbacterium sp. CPCC 204701 TaxID=2493084 RepID=UPI000FD9B9FD|nr:hypothetical protein [Microbacterium sp. CPCC 204701]